MLKSKSLKQSTVVSTNYPSKKIFIFFTNNVDFILESLSKHIKDSSVVRTAIEKAIELKINNKLLIILNKKWINIQLRTLECKIKSNNISRIKNKDYNASIIIFGEHAKTSDKY